MKTLILSALAALFATAALADAPVGNNFTTPQKPAPITFVLTGSTSPSTWFTMEIGGSASSGATVPTTGNAGMECKALSASNDDASNAHNVIWHIIDASGNEVQKVGVVVPANAGQFGVPTQPLMGPTITPGTAVDAKGNPIFELYPGWSIQVADNDSGVAAGKFLAIYGTCYLW